MVVQQTHFKAAVVALAYVKNGFVVVLTIVSRTFFSFGLAGLGSLVY